MSNTKEKYIANGNIFHSYEDVIDYCKENGYRVTNTETVKKNTYVISITKL